MLFIILDKTLEEAWSSPMIEARRFGRATSDALMRADDANNFGCAEIYLRSAEILVALAKRTYYDNVLSTRREAASWGAASWASTAGVR